MLLIAVKEDGAVEIVGNCDELELVHDATGEAIEDGFSEKMILSDEGVTPLRVELENDD